MTAYAALAKHRAAKIHHNIPFEATSEKKIRGEGAGVHVKTKLSWDPWMPNPRSPASKILATRLISISNMHSQSVLQTDGRTDRQTDRQTDGQTMRFHAT